MKDLNDERVAPSQRSLVDQLADLAALGDRHGLYDAADFVRSTVPAVRQAESYRECQGCGFEWYEGNPDTPERHRSACPLRPADSGSDEHD